MAVATHEVVDQTVQQGAALANKNLISDQLWTRLVNRIVKDEEIEPALSERIMDQALGFLRLCAERPGNGYSPSEAVDTGWHTFVLYTREYAEFCQRIAGRFIHHAPNDEVGISYDSTGGAERTVAAMQALGIVVDLELWQHSANCKKDCKSDPPSCKNPTCRNCRDE